MNGCRERAVLGAYRFRSRQLNEVHIKLALIHQRMTLATPVFSIELLSNVWAVIIIALALQIFSKKNPTTG